MKTSGNGELWQFFSSNKSFLLPLLLNHYDIQQALNDNEAHDKYAIILKSSSNQSHQFSLMWYDDLKQDSKSSDIFNRYFKNGQFKVIKISSSIIDAEKDAHVPSALPCYVHPKMAVLNKRPPKATLDVIEDCQRMLTVTDITSLYETIYQPIVDTAQELPEDLPKEYYLQPSTIATALELVTTEIDDLRNEDRFKLEFDITITRRKNVPTEINGKTKNVSIQGLLIKLNTETKFTAGEEIEISLTVPFFGQTRTLKKQKYQVLGYDNKGDIRLLMNEIESKHLACRAIRKYIFQNNDDLVATGQRGSGIYGFQKATRNIYAHNHFSVPFYLKATKHHQYINAASFSDNSDFKHLVYQNDNCNEIILSLLSNKKFKDACLSIIAALSSKNLLSKAFYILVLPKDKNQEQEYSFWFRDLSVLKKTEQLQAYTNKALSLGQPAILKVELKKNENMQTKYYRDEIDYLKTLDKDLANDLETQLNSTIGIGEVTDLTSIALSIIKKAK